ncbi:related to cell cycle control protein cwf15 [Melanopsichium pennsylvanicum]|uniref:Related to cell cycle control protein cwf15 n=1 Tax=Melanopsichium pennsylvanicum TaxID=63383 RepID=A0AAJ4XHU1_9BASI|nr:related to cell cycle control protein cwf15 [Melanopsichium pennsylvanicum]
MSSAHRPTFQAAKGRESKAHLSQQTTIFDIPSHTKLKFRAPPSSSSSLQSGESSRRDLKRELEHAELEAKNAKRIKQGLEPLPMPFDLNSTQVKQEESKRKQAILLAIELDKDDDYDNHHDSQVSSETEQDDSDDDQDNQVSTKPQQNDSDDSDETDSNSDDEDHDLDQQAQLLKELEKIKAEREKEKLRATGFSEEQEINLGNPLLNLENSFQSRNSADDHDKMDFVGEVRRRWDDDIIFKNQANGGGSSGSSSRFVNDLSRSEFHRKFMNRYIK